LCCKVFKISLYHYNLVYHHQFYRFWGAPTIAGGKALMEARELTKLALERSKTAREAVHVMGDLATTYGFYAADWSGGDASKGEGGEALTVVDKNEAWVFHILADDTGASAVWAAQRYHNVDIILTLY
jgi:dipeptidase